VGGWLVIGSWLPQIVSRISTLENGVAASKCDFGQRLSNALFAARQRPKNRFSALI